MTDPTAPERRLREVYKQAILARERLDRDTPAWTYAHEAGANAESALVCLEGADVLDDLDVPVEGDNA